MKVTEIFDMPITAPPPRPLYTDGGGTNHGTIHTGGVGDDVLDGGAGHDTAQFSGLRSDYVIARNGESIVVTDTVAGRDGSDRLHPHRESRVCRSNGERRHVAVRLVSAAQVSGLVMARPRVEEIGLMRDAMHLDMSDAGRKKQPYRPYGSSRCRPDPGTGPQAI